jgi:hypothetical protein
MEIPAKAAGIVCYLLLLSNLTLGIEKQYPHTAAVRATIIIPGHPDSQVRDPIIVKITNTGDRRAEVIISFQVAVKPPGSVGHLLPRINLAIRFHHQDPDRASIVGAVIIIRGAYRQIRDAVAVHIPDNGNRATKTIIVMEIPAKAAGIVRYLLFLLDLALGIEKQYPHTAPIRATIIIPGYPDSQVKSTIGVEITDTCNRTAKQVVITEVSSKTTCIAGDLLFLIDPPIVIHEQDPDRALVAAIVIIKGSAHGQVPDTVSFQVAGFRKRAAELIPAVEISIKTATVCGDLLLAAYPDLDIRTSARRILVI